jgi:2-furoyl-CoA dehydrogenase FAD binding subunit
MASEPSKAVQEAQVKPAAFDYVRAESLDEALAVLAEEGADARIIAGGQSFMAMLNMRLARPKVVVDIMRISGIDQIDEARGEIIVGAGVRQADLLGWDKLATRLPLVALSLPWTGHVQTRSRGTICGSIAHADPSAEMPLSLIALGGSVHLRNARKRRRLPAADYITGMMNTARADDEIIEAVSFPVVAGRGHGFREVARRHGDFAIVACAAIVSHTGVRFAVGGVADKPEARDWPRLEGTALDDALNAFAYEMDARSDVHATARYRRELVRRVGRAVIEEAVQCRV